MHVAAHTIAAAGLGWAVHEMCAIRRSSPWFVQPTLSLRVCVSPMKCPAVALI
jgi:hypothetical protein